jgi:hypothetical protein
VYKWGHFGALGLRGSERFESKEHVGELKEIDPHISNIKYNIGDLINLGAISKKV